jgi:hypothetical protein
MGKKVLPEKNCRLIFIHSSSHLCSQQTTGYSHKLQSLSTKIKSFPTLSIGYAQPAVQKDFPGKQDHSSANAVINEGRKMEI